MKGNVHTSDHDRSDLPNGTPEGKPTHANGPEGERWLRSVVENSSEIIKVVDLDGTLRYASPALKRALGYDPDEVIGTNVLDYVHPDDLPRVIEETEKALMEGGETRNVAEYRFRHKDGSWRHVESVGTYLLDDPGVRGVVVNVRDVTERKEAERALKESEERFRSLVQNASDVITILDADGTVRYVSPAIERMLGYLPEDRTGRSGFELLHPDDLARARSAFAEALRSPGVVTLGVRMLHRDGSWRDVEVAGTNLLDDPSVSGIVVNWHDVTEKRRAEVKLRENEERYRSQARELSLLHQVRTALAQELDLSNVFHEVVEAIAETYGYTQVSAYLLEGEDLVLQHQVGYHRVIDRIAVTEGISGRAIRTGRPILLEDVRTDPDFLGAIEDIASEICVPLFDEGEAVGFINVESRGGVKLTHKDLELMVALGEHVSVAVVRARLHTAVRKSEERFRSLGQNSSDVILVMGPDETVRYISPAVERVLGYKPEQVVGHDNFTPVHPDDMPRMEKLIGEVMDSPGITTSPMELRLRHVDGSWRYVETTCTNLLGDPAVGGIVFNTRDVTERKEAEEALRESEERYRTVVEEQTELVCRFAPDLTLTFVNDAYCRYFGQTQGEVIGESFIERVAVEDRVYYEEQLAWLTEDNPTRTVEHRVLTPDGEVRWQQWTDRAIFDAEDKPVEYQSVGRDVTDRKRAEQALLKSEASLAEAQRLAHLGSWEWDIETDEVSWSDEVYRIYGFAPQELVPNLERFMEVVHPEDRGRIEAVIDGALNDHKPYDLEHRIVRPDGELRWVHRRAEVFRDEGGEPVRMVGTVHDVTERKALEDRLRHQAFHDSLTDLPNRLLFVDRLEQALRRARRQRGRGVAVLFMDLDEFKVVNDSLGHEAGDLLLTVVAQRLGHCLRPEDTLARFGGDEFVVLLEDMHSPEDAVRVTERILEALSRPFLLQGRELFVNVSIGVALGGTRWKRSGDLLRDADTAMYEAKSEAASGYRVFDPAMHERVLSRLDQENDLRRAMEAGEFVVHYQPIVQLDDGRLRGVEALVRWNHPERGLLDPSEFVAVAEESGLVVPLGEKVLREACLRAKEWQEEHPRIPPLVMSVNLSARQLSRPDLAEIVEGILRETGLEGSCLTLDVTETVYVKALEGNTASLDRLRAMGVRISIDDFGTGYSSLYYLKMLPADAIKIDKSFVKGLGDDVEDTAIVRMVVELAHTLGMEVIAEGVESEEQALLLREMGCDMAQGFHFAKPLPPEAASRFLEG